jgi:membrane protein DedA with SNARE-associated domain
VPAPPSVGRATASGCRTLAPVDAPADRPAAPRRRIPLPLLLTPIVAPSVVGSVADVVGPGLITERPLLQMFLNPRNRYLLLAAPQVDPVPFLVVGFLRLVLTDPLFYLLGVQYGDAALRWAERRLADEAGFIRRFERLFARASHVIVTVAPNGYMCLFAGATGMPARTFVALDVTGTIGRLALFWFVGEAFRGPLLDVLDWVQRYQWWLIAASVVLVSLQTRRQRRQGRLETVGEMEEEILGAGAANGGAGPAADVAGDRERTDEP